MHKIGQDHDKKVIKKPAFKSRFLFTDYLILVLLIRT
ncbi:hypothetical protein Q757_07565 [Oenococcus alcoholitolerans]|uniref:Uncharacterized protein n=1 Tax=Oenococcus alcoholitolerans TaxID=931074 RepID=A0ABR4XPN4_9LACO|nr:hypothetical protein Q757_07565 [Oenococcus alcoholitolerans]